MAEQGEFVKGTADAPHLGGFVRGGDPDTQYPEMWDWLVGESSIRSVLDLGCGDGAAMAVFRELGCTVFGVDGVPQEHPGISVHDFTTGAYDPGRRFDLIWCCEFVEHVEERYVDNILQTIHDAARPGGLVALTHALPGQPGWHHVNCQPPEYWVEKMAAIHFLPEPRLTEEARKLAHGYFAATGVIFS